MRWLALDIGAKRVGVALSDSEERVVSPHTAIPFGSPQDLAKRVGKLVESLGVESVLVGMPTTRSGQSRGEERVQKVVAALSQALPVPVITWDERGTTSEAEALLAGSGVPSKKRRGVVDALAAAVLLESFLALRKEKTSGS